MTTAILRSLLADLRGRPVPTPPWERGRTVMAPAPRLYLSDRRRVELAFPALVAMRLAGVLIPVGRTENTQVRQARTIFRDISLEPLADLPETQRASLCARAMLLRAWLLDPYADRSGMTIFRAFTTWLDDLRQRGVLVIDPAGRFLATWDALADGIHRHPGNLDQLDQCRRSATRLAAEWRRRLEGRGYYTDT